MRKYIFIFLTLFVFNATGQELTAYKLYTGKGKPVSAKKMMKSLRAVDFIFFGEYHNDPIAHWLQLEIQKELNVAKGGKVMLSFEMFEQDQQMLMDEYLAGKLTDKQFEDSCRLWSNYETDYKPLILHAKENKLRVVASNIPRKYASLLFKSGRAALDTLSELEKSWIAPLDFKIDSTLSQYAALIEMASHMGGGNLLEAQAIKDATMAFFIAKNRNNGETVIHYNGAYHSDYYQGVIWYLEQELGLLNKRTISTVSQASVAKLDKENYNRADFIICVDEDMTKTH
jgi:uncharacterized iron-regulated protein